MQKKSKILITGVGYVGSYLCKKALEYGYEVRAMDNFHKGNCDTVIPLCANPDFEFMCGDVTNEKHVKKAVEGVDAIIHLAALVGFPACAKQPKLSYLVNVEGTANILKYRKDAKLLFASTGSVYGKIDNICTEDSPLNPQSEYGEHKLLAEKLVRAEKDTLSYRFATGFGISPCMRVNLLINDLVYQAYHNKCITIFEADAKRTFIHVRDMCKAFMFGIKTIENTTHNVYNVGSTDNNWSKRKLANYIGDKTKAVVQFMDIGKDLDMRDYEVNYDRYKKQFPNHKMESVSDGIDELIKIAPLIQIRHQYE